MKDPPFIRHGRDDGVSASPVGIVVGLAAEGRIARRLGRPVAIGGGTAAGAEAAALRLVVDGAAGLISFGLCGGLDPTLRPGALLIPEAVLDGPTRYAASTTLAGRFGGLTAHVLLGATQVAATAAEKRGLHQATGADAIDLESGAVARVAAAADIPFAVLRAVCDPADQDLPPAALVALDVQGTIGFLRILAALVARPRQIFALLTLARQAASARRSLLHAIMAAGITAVDLQGALE